MGSTFLSLHYHVVFSTKERRPFIHDSWRTRLHEYLGGTVRGLSGVPEAVGGVADHVHLLIGLRASHCLADFMREMKKASSIWSAENHEPLFGWQDGYGVFTVSQSKAAEVIEYIKNQREHHGDQSFEEEYVSLLKLNGIDYDERFVFD